MSELSRLEMSVLQTRMNHERCLLLLNEPYDGGFRTKLYLMEGVENEWDNEDILASLGSAFYHRADPELAKGFEELLEDHGWNINW